MKVQKVMVPAVPVLALAGLLAGCGDSGEKKALVQYLEKQSDVQKQMVEADKKTAARFQEMQDQVAGLRKDLEEIKKLTAVPHNTDTVKSIDGAIQISTTPEPRIRTGICTILAQFGGDLAEQRLIQLAEKDTEVQVRLAALTGLNTMNSQAIVRIAPTKLDSSNYDERQAAAQIMQQKPVEAFRIPALAALAKDPVDNYSNHSARQSLYRVMAIVGKPEDLPVLRAACDKESRDSKRAALAAITSVACGDYETLLEVLSSNTDPNCFDEITLTKLDRVADMRLTPALLPACASDNWRTRQAVYTLLGRLKDPLAAAKLAERFKTEGDGDCKRALTTVFTAGFPGIVFTAPNQCALVPDAELKKLLAEREQKLQQLPVKKPK